MSGEGRPVMRIPSIFDSDDDSEDESISPVTFRAISATATTKPVTESQTEPSPAPSQQPQSLSSNSESDVESLSPKPEEPKDGKATVGSPHVPSSSEDSEDSEDVAGEKDLVFSSREERLEDEEEDDEAFIANEEDDINISHSSPENQDGSEDDDDDSSNSDDDDDDESDEEQDRSGSSVEYEGAVLSEDGGSHVVYSPAMPLSIKITAKKGEFAIRQETTFSKPPFQAESKGDREKESRPEEEEKKPTEIEEGKIESLEQDKKDNEEKMELAETSKTEEKAVDKTEEIAVDENDKIEATEEKEDKKDTESSSSSRSTPVDEKIEEKDENKEKLCRVLHTEEKEEEKEEEDTMNDETENIVHSEHKESKDEKPLDDLETEDMESTKGEASDSKIVTVKSPDRRDSEPMETAEKEEDSKPEVTETQNESDESDSGALEIESPEPQEPEIESEKLELETGKELNENEEKEEEQEPMEVEEEEDVITEKEAKDETDNDTQETEEETKDEKEEENEEVIKKPTDDKATTSVKEEEKKEEEKENKIEEKEKQVTVPSIFEGQKRDEIPRTAEKDEESVDNEDVEMKECPEEIEEEEKEGVNKEEEEEEVNKEEEEEVSKVKEEEKEVSKEKEGKVNKEVDKDIKLRDSSPPPPPPPVSVVLDSDTDSEATLDTQKARDIITAAAAKRIKVPLRVEDVYMDSEDDSQSLSKQQGKAGSEDRGGGGDKGSQSVMTSETDSVDPEDQRDCLSQHSSSRASSTDLFIKVSSCSPRADSPCDTPTSARQMPRTKKTYVPSDADLANYTEAFRQGWRREIVFRATQNPTKGGSARADIYYYCPTGKKLRSRVEIEDYLLRAGITDLTLRNFTWIKEPLGVSEEYEVIRHASNKSGGGAVGPSRRKPGQGTPNSTSSSPASTPKYSASSQINTPKAPPVVTITSITRTPPVTRSPHTTKAPTISAPPAVSGASASSTTPGTPVVPSTKTTGSKITYLYDVSGSRKRGRGRPRKYEETPPKRARMKTTPIVPILIKKDPSRGSVGPAPPPPPPPPPPPISIATHSVTSGMMHPHVMSMVPQRPVLPTPTPRPKQTRKTKDPVVTTGHVTMLPPCPPKILTPMLMGGARHRTFHCTGNCPLGGGSVPCLQCVKCLCLFHPECTCMPPPTVSIIQAGAARFLCPNCYRENKENMGSDKWVPPEPFEPLAHDPTSSSSSSDSDEEGDQAGKEVWAEEYAKVILRPDTPPTPPSSPSPSHSIGPWRADESDSRQEQASDQPQAAGSGEGEPMQVVRNMPSVSGVPSGSPAVGGQLVQIQQQGTGPACFLLVQGGPGAPGGELMPVTGGGGPVGVPKGMSSIIIPRLPIQQQQQLQMAAPVMIQQQPFQPACAPVNVPPQNSIQPKQDRPMGKHYKKYYETMSQWDNTFLGELSHRYLLLRHIFKYLSVRDLLVASQVCLLWRDLAFSSSLWETVRLRNVCVSDWSEFARFLERRNTKNIDLRKMRLKKQDVKKKVKRRIEQKLASKEASTSFQPIHKTSKKPGTPKNQKTDSKTEKRNAKNTAQGDTEEASSSKLHQNSKTKISAESSQVSDQKSEDRSRSVVDEKDRNGHRKEKEVQEEEMETEDDQEEGTKHKKGVDEAQESQSSDDIDMEYTEEEKEHRVDVDAEKIPTRKQEAEEDEWLEIFTALSNVRCLRGVTLPSCPGHVLQLLLASCKHITSINAMDLRQPSGCVRFDPAYLMEASNLVELRVGSPSGFTLTTNFNFIKLQKLRVLVMRGLSGDTWPYLGTNLTTLQVGPIRTFTTSTWANLGNMTKLQALWLEEGGLVSDLSIYDGLSRLTSLRRLCLFNFVVGPKLGHALRKLPHLERLFVLPMGTEEASIKSQNSNMLAAMEVLRHVEELVWGVHASDVFSSGGADCIHLCPTKAKLFPGMIENPENGLWPLPQLEKVVKRHMPHSNVRIIKLDPTAASHLALATL